MFALAAAGVVGVALLLSIGAASRRVSAAGLEPVEQAAQ
jgi:hypothetical protein